MLCGGHVARAFTKSLGELAKQKSFSPALRDIHRKKFPAVDTVKCHCPIKGIQKIVDAFLRVS